MSKELPSGQSPNNNPFALTERMRLRPTVEQYQAFGNYVGGAHSSYKHLPLMSGRWFVVFVSPDAGLGNLVFVQDDATGVLKLVPSPKGPEFTEANPRLHYGWQTTKEYRLRFGYLDYMRRTTPEEPNARDAGPPIPLPPQLEERCSFLLYPYVSPDFADAVTWYRGPHSNAIQQLRDGATHPDREEVLELVRLAEELEITRNGLRDLERQWFAGHQSHPERPLPQDPSVSLLQCVELDANLGTVSRSLMVKEDAKIRRALAELDDWLTQGQLKE